MLSFRRKPWDAPNSAMQYCAVTVTAVAAVAAAGTAAYGAYSAKQTANDAKDEIAKNKDALYGKRPELPDFRTSMELPHYNPGEGMMDYWHALPLLTGIAKTTTNQMAKERDMLSGGMASDNLKQSGADIGQLLKGGVPQDVQDRVSRMVAERGAGAYTPGGPAGQQAGMDFARSIGATSADMMKAGLSYAPQWESMVDAFTYKPQQAFGDALSALRERDNYALNKAALQLKADEDVYSAKVNQRKAESGPDPRAAGSFRDNLMLNMMSNQADMNMMNAMTGAVKGVAGAYGGMGGGMGGGGFGGGGGSSFGMSGFGGGGGGGYNSAGYINPGAYGQVANTYAMPGYTPTFATSPQGGYFTGYIPS